jgi:hypothetical protein
MKVSQTSLAVKVAHEAGKPLFFWGAPGIGKSAGVKAAAGELGFTLSNGLFRDFRASQCDPCDIRGLPFGDDSGDVKTMAWLQPDWLPQDSKSAGIILLDELPDAPIAVQSALYELTLDRRIGSYRLPDGWSIVAAGNRQEDRAASGRLSTALANRFWHVTVEADLDGWCDWALQNGVQTEVISFLRFRPELLHQFDPTRQTEKAFPSPRSWEIVSAINAAKPAREIELECYQGAVGNGAGAEFAAFVSVWRKLPNIDNVILNPTTAEVPTEPSVLYALTGALARRASDATAGQLIQYADRLPQEFGVLLVRDCSRRCSEFTTTRPYIDWTSRNADVLL